MTTPGPTVTVKAPPGTRVQMRMVEGLLARRKCPDCTPTRVVAEFDPAVNPDPDAAAGWTVTTWHAAGCPGLVLRLLQHANPKVPVAFDNGCFGKGWPGESAWFGWLQRNAYRIPNTLFAVAPDVVGDAAATLDRSAPWLPRIRSLGYPAAFVAQNGAEHAGIPWDDIDALFLGGSAECLHCEWVRPVEDRDTEFCPGCYRRLREWKLGSVARRLASEAHARGKRLHMGRVNSGIRFSYARLIGCQTADGTTLAKFPDATLPDVLNWSSEPVEPGLLGVDAL